MLIKYNIQKEFTTPEIHICTAKLDSRAQEIFDTVKDMFEKTVNGYREGYDEASVIRISDIVRVYAASKHVYVSTESEKYVIRGRLYEMEKELENLGFVRISNSEIVNVKAIKHLDASVTGTIKMTLRGQIETFVSRRYVPKIKQSLGL